MRPEVTHSLHQGFDLLCVGSRIAEVDLSLEIILALAFVPVERFFQIGMGVLNSWECAPSSPELLAAGSAGSDRRTVPMCLTILTAGFFMSSQSPGGRKMGQRRVGVRTRREGICTPG